MPAQTEPDADGEQPDPAAALRELGATVRRLRERAGLTQTAAAGATGTTQGYWSRLEAGRVDPSIGLALRIVRLFKLDSIESLFGPARSASLARREETNS